MINEYNKGGSFKDYIDKAVKCNGTTPEIEFQKVITKEYYRSLREGVNKDEPETAGRTDTSANIKCDC